MEAAHVHAPTARDLAEGLNTYDADDAKPKGAVESAIDDLDRMLGILADRLEQHALRLGPALHPGHPMLAEALRPEDGEAVRHSDLAESIEHRNARLQTMILQLESLTYRIDL